MTTSSSLNQISKAGQLDQNNLKQEIQLNVLPIIRRLEKVSVAFSKNASWDSFPFKLTEIKEALVSNTMNLELPDSTILYANFAPDPQNGLAFNLDLSKSVRFTTKYYRNLIAKYFKDHADIVNIDFINSVTVWFELENPAEEKNKIDNEEDNKEVVFRIYEKFTLKIQHARLTDGYELAISYNGTSQVSARSILDIEDIDTTLYTRVIFNGRLYRWKNLPDNVKSNLDQTYPVLSIPLKKQLKIPFDKPNFNNKYLKYHEKLQSFYNTHILSEEFSNLLPTSPDGFIKPAEDQIILLPRSSNQLVFGNNQVGIDPARDFKRWGPHKSIPTPVNVRFFFIYRTKDKELHLKIVYNYLRNGFRGKYTFPSMKQYLGFPFELSENENHIAFDNINEAVDVVKNKLKETKRSENHKYFAIFLNPVGTDETDEKLVNIYYKIKEILLYEGIPSQVIKADKVIKNNKINDYYNTFLPKIEIAILAKLGGIPWRINRNETNELIVGIGASYDATRKTRFVGSAFCFDNTGVFKGFDCFRAADIISIAGSIREAVDNFMKTNENVSRLIIHFYKEISKKELKPIEDLLENLGLDIPVYVLSINKTLSKDYLAFDLDSAQLMPYSGTIVKIDLNDYLLFNNTRYNQSASPKGKHHFFPLRIRLSGSNTSNLDDSKLITELFDHVFQFSRMYWKSTDPQNIPVTISYPEMVAKIYPNFSKEHLPEYGKNNLWFL
jgi:hypothetical protein